MTHQVALLISGGSLFNDFDFRIICTVLIKEHPIAKSIMFPRILHVTAHASCHRNTRKEVSNQGAKETTSSRKVFVIAFPF